MSHSASNQMKLQNPTSSSASFVLMPLHLILLFCISLLSQPTSTIANALRNETDRFGLLKFRESVSNDPYNVLSSWNNSVHHCNWHGITCGRRHQRITTLNLQDYGLRGTISPYIGNLTFLRFINLINNSFLGEIPKQVLRLFRLKSLLLSYNVLEGRVPINLTYCPDLRVLALGTNKLTGIIPAELGSLKKLEMLNLESNKLTGSIPPSLGNISSLGRIYVSDNNLVGAIPEELGRLKSLTVLSINTNGLSGMIPLDIYNISSMTNLSITDNQFKGSLPPSIGLMLPNLQELFAGGNNFSGTIPESFSNCSQIQVLSIAENNFVGQVPSSFASLPNLKQLVLEDNNLGGYLANSLDFIDHLANCSKMEVLSLAVNNFGGVLPNSVANFSTGLTHLYLGGNRISGRIHAGLENLVNLIILTMEHNLLIGVIPDSLGKLKNLQVLGLEWNMLSGKIPSSIGNLTQISDLSFSHNKLDRSIPPNIANCRNLQFLDIAQNSLGGSIPKEIFGLSSSILLDLSGNILTGSLPHEVGKLKAANEIDLSENNLTNEIPNSIGDCESLERLYLQGNFFMGNLPFSLSSLRGLQFLDLSRNNLSGKIPKDLEKLPYLLNLNLSFNDLEGEVPKGGVFKNTSVISLVGNSKLCGGVTKLQLPACPIIKPKTKSRLKLTFIIIGVVGFLLLFSFSVLLFWRRKSTRKSLSSLSTIHFLSKVSYKRLYEATNGFSPSMLIGAGSFGSVYKGIDLDQNLIAIKVLNLQKEGASKSFIAECNVLRSIRHRNLVKILTCCSSLDYNGNDFKALVFEYMSNGSLEKWLHPDPDSERQSRDLNLIQRLNIVSNVASAVHYLHDHCSQVVIHCDLKPSNILLDNEMVAHVSDFGLTRLISDSSLVSENQTSTIGMKGTVGYVPPEYATGGEPSRQGDVYSFGILVLEIFTGRRPTDEMFKDDFNLHNFVKLALPERLVQIVDSALLPREVEETTVRRQGGRSYGDIEGIEINTEERHINLENQNPINANLFKCLVSVLEIGLSCSKESPNERMNMEDVTRELQHVRNAYLQVGVRRRVQRTN